MEWRKVQSAAKKVLLPGPELDRKVLKTMKTVADCVGATLGPGGRPVLIERQDYGMPGLVTKDGVTVFRSLGFSDPAEHSIMESARDAAVRTVNEAGDGTTTATVLAYALVKYSQQYLTKNPTVSPQSIVQDLQEAFLKVVEPLLRKLSIKVNFGSKQGQRILRAVATISANGDEKLADAVMEAFRLVGDNGTVTIIESSGPTAYRVERIHGYPIPMGYEESCQKFMTAFINEPATGRVYLKNPYFALYNGTCTDVQTMVAFLDKAQAAWLNRPGLAQHNPEQPFLTSPNIVLVANGFSEAVLGTLAMVMPAAETINVVPLVVPRSAILNGEVHFLEDLAAITGAEVLNPLSRPFDSVSAELTELGRVDVAPGQPGEFEMFRFRSTVIGRNDEDEVADRAEQVQSMVENAVSEYDSRLLKERLACLTGGIAKLTVVGSSNGELRERKDRADDAVRSVQGAIKQGALPGGGWALLRLVDELATRCWSPVIHDVLLPALLEPVRKLLENVGHHGADVDAVLDRLCEFVASAPKARDAVVLDLSTRGGQEVSAFKAGILDSTPAVLEALRSSLSIAALLGTLGGLVVFERDHTFERSEAEANNQFVRDANTNAANEHW